MTKNEEQQAIQALYNGQDAVAILPTGFGLFSDAISAQRTEEALCYHKWVGQQFSVKMLHMSKQ